MRVNIYDKFISVHSIQIKYRRNEATHKSESLPDLNGKDNKDCPQVESA